MHFQTDEKLPFTIRLAHVINRTLTWGMARDERRRLLSEGLADWEAMAEELSARQVFLRAFRGIPAAIWIRLSDREVTAMPAGIALTMVGLGGITAGVQSTSYPTAFRQSTILASIGLVLVGVNFVRDPRRVVLSRYRAAGVVAAAGFAGLAVTLPTTAQWPYDGPVLENRLGDAAMQASFVIIAVGFLLLTAASLVPRRSRLVLEAGVTVMVGAVVLGVAQIVWGISMSPIDLPMTAAAIVIGLAALSFAHVLPRLRHLTVVQRDAMEHGVHNLKLRKGTR
jgi:hypothetical protein